MTIRVRVRVRVRARARVRAGVWVRVRLPLVLVRVELAVACVLAADLLPADRRPGVRALAAIDLIPAAAVRRHRLLE
eukprot:scaffold72485_cov58-Phaeocystis_antarctica.AAC.1